MLFCVAAVEDYTEYITSVEDLNAQQAPSAPAPTTDTASEVHVSEDNSTGEIKEHGNLLFNSLKPQS